MTTSNRIFYLTIVLSLVIHLYLIGVFSSAKRYFQKPFKQIEVTYQLNEKENKTAEYQEIEAPPVKLIKESRQMENIKVLTRKDDRLLNISPLLKDLSKQAGPIQIDRKLTPKISFNDSERRVIIPEIKSEKITNPKYISYSQEVSQRIRRRALDYLNDQKSDFGEVYLTFILYSDGRLKAVRIREDETDASDYLKEIALRSIKDSSPFPEYANDLNYPELPLNLRMIFKETY